MEIPKVGQVWIEERNFEQRIDLEYHDFVGAFTGRAYEVLQDCEDHGRYNTYLTYHTLNGKPAIFVWAELKTESYAPNNIEVTLQIPKALLPAILGRNTQGYTVWGKVRRDMMKLYERKAATK